MSRRPFKFEIGADVRDFHTQRVGKVIARGEGNAENRYRLKFPNGVTKWVGELDLTEAPAVNPQTDPAEEVGNGLVIDPTDPATRPANSPTPAEEVATNPPAAVAETVDATGKGAPTFVEAVTELAEQATGVRSPQAEPVTSNSEPTEKPAETLEPVRDAAEPATESNAVT